MRMRVEAMALEMPQVDGHPNRHEFRGVLTLADAPSERAPSGARGHRVLLTAEATGRAGNELRDCRRSRGGYRGSGVGGNRVYLHRSGGAAAGEGGVPGDEHGVGGVRQVSKFQGFTGFKG